METAISVIIPMYNAGKYIGECLESLANQTFQDFDVIIVDDCSTDNSRKVVQSFSEKFSGRMKLKKLSKNSGYAGLARNAALNMARGKYVYFLDADDLIAPDALENLYTAAENFDADVVQTEKFFAFQDELGKESSEVTSYQTSEFVTAPTLETFDLGARVKGFTQKRFLWGAGGKFVRKKFLRDNKITFPAIKSWEDFVFSFECLVAAKNYVRVPFVNYYYRLRDDSLSHEAGNGIRFMDNLIGVVKSADDFMSGRKFFEDNPQYKFMVTDFFMQERIKVFSKFFTDGEHDIGKIYNFLNKAVFSRRTQDTAALTSYLFVAANILKIYTEELEAEN